MRALHVLRRDQRGYTLTELMITVAVLGLIMAAVLAVQMTSNTMFLRGENQADAQQGARAAMLMEEDLRMAGYGCPDNGCPTDLGTLNYSTTGTQLKISEGQGSSITFWADTLNASTPLSATVAAGATTLPVTDASRIAVNDRIYLNNGGTAEACSVTAIAGNNLTVASCTDVPPCLPAGICTTIASLHNLYPQGVQVGRPRKIVYSFANGVLNKDAGDGAGLQTLATGVQSLTFTYFPDTSDTLIALMGTPAKVPSANLPTVRRVQVSTTTQSTTSAAEPGTFTINTNVRPRNL